MIRFFKREEGIYRSIKQVYSNLKAYLWIYCVALNIIFRLALDTVRGQLVHKLLPDYFKKNGFEKKGCVEGSLLKDPTHF